MKKAGTALKLQEAKITLLIGHEKTTIELYDSASGIQFAEITLTPEQLNMALARQGYTPCAVTVRGLHKLGKRMEHKPLAFPFSAPWLVSHEEKIALARVEAKKHVSEGWESDGYFGSRDSFYKEKGIEMAKTSQRRWVKIEEEPPREIDSDTAAGYEGDGSD